MPRALLVCLLFAGAAAPAFADATTKGTGPNGQPLTDAKIVIQVYDNRETVDGQGKTNAQGLYTCTLIPQEKVKDFYIIVTPKEEDLDEVAIVVRGIKDKQVIPMQVKKRRVPPPDKPPF